jgi:hypothetical protein
MNFSLWKYLKFLLQMSINIAYIFKKNKNFAG